MPDPEPPQGDPMIQLHEESAGTASDIPQTPTGAPKPCGDQSILLIDDDVAGAQGMAKLLRRHGYTVLLAGNGVAALRWIAKEPIGLVITDIFMDEMDGLETIMKLRQRHVEVPIVAISGGSPSIPMDCLVLARSMGAASVLHKPVQIGMLLDVIAQHGHNLARSTGSTLETL